MPKLLTYKELREHGVLLKRTQIKRLEDAGKFPKRLKIGERYVAWVADEIKAHVDAQIKARR